MFTTRTRTSTITGRTVCALLGAGLLGVLGTACGDEADADGVAPPTSHDDMHDEEMSVTIGGVDYGFTNVPESVPAGTTLGFDNMSTVELHELVAFRLDTEQPLDELLQQPPAQLEATLGAPVTVILRPPGSPAPIMAVGDGTLTEPGRYVIMCFIPIGADPAEYLAAAEAAGGGKPEGVAGGPPHFTAGMVAELVVE